MAGEVVVFDHFPQIIGALRVVGKQKVIKATMAIAQIAAGNAAVDTGFMQSSIYTQTAEGSTYGQGIVPGKGDSYLLDEVEPPENDQTGHVAVAANYGIFQEMGSSRNAAQPYLVPALEAVRSAFESGEGWEQALAQIVGAGL